MSRDRERTEADIADTQIQARRAIEALRSGVPNRDAVAALGTAQDAVVQSFRSMLSGVTTDDPGRTSAGRRGLILGGGFGSGKSHVLEHLAHEALEANFVVSRVVISKETPLHDPTKVFRAAAESAQAPGRQGAALPEITASLDTRCQSFADFSRWVDSPESGLNKRFAATLFLFDGLRGNDMEFVDLIVRFWAGDPLRVPDVRRRLKESGEAVTFDLVPIKERDLSIERARFVSRLVQAAGFAGWVVLVDEVELIGRYSVLQRAKAYGEVARWVRGTPSDDGVPVRSVLAVSDDFAAAVLEGKNDLETIPNKLRARADPTYDLMAGHAETGMRLLNHDVQLLERPDQAVLDATYQRVKSIHGAAYGWEPGDVYGVERDVSTRMRQYVRAWINEWDLGRLDSSYVADTEVTSIEVGYGEDVDLGGGAGDSGE